MAEDYHRKFRLQTATLWELDGYDSAQDPEFSSASPRQINVRWEDRFVNFINQDGEEEAASGFVIVGEDLKAGDWLYLGTSAAADPTTLIGAAEVKGYEKVTSPSNRYITRKVYLSFRRAF